MNRFFFFFFFQAEDGIRDLYVTGVQTCALPISDIDVPVTVLPDREAVLAGADCLLVLTDWDEFAATPRDAFKAMRRPLVIDCVGVVDPRRTELDGVELVRMGHPGGER